MSKIKKRSNIQRCYREKGVILKYERNYRLSSLKLFFLLHLLNPSLERFAARKVTAEGRRADKGALSRLIYILRLTTAPSYEEREKSLAKLGK